MKAIGRAFGKVILLGEHAVVYGRPALAVGVEPGAEAEFEADADAKHAEPSPPLQGALSLDVAPINVRVRDGDDTELGRALAAMRASLGDAARSARLPLAGRIAARLFVPSGGGLGSSAALGVAIARALGSWMLGDKWTDDATLAAALAWEKVFHGNPSGIDHTMALFGGAGVYTRGSGIERLPLRRSLRVLLADTGERSPTRTMVESVARIHARRTDATEKTLDAIAAIVRNGALALQADDGEDLGRLMNMNQTLLAGLMLSTERTETLCALAREAGAWGAKLTGGGGGGCVIAICEAAHEAAVLGAWGDAGAPTYVVQVSKSA